MFRIAFLLAIACQQPPADECRSNAECEDIYLDRPYCYYEADADGVARGTCSECRPGEDGEGDCPDGTVCEFVDDESGIFACR